MSIGLDEVDFDILSILQDDARTPFTKIAKRLGVSDATIHGRVRKMEDKDLIEKYTTIINDEMIKDYISAHVLIRVEPGTVEKVCTRLMELDEVLEICEIHERYDIIVKVRGSSLEEIRDTLIQKIRSIPDVVGSETYTVFKTWKRNLGVRIEHLKEKITG